MTLPFPFCLRLYPCQIRRALNALFTMCALWGLQGCSSLVADSAVTAMPNGADAVTTWQPEDQMTWEVVRIPGKVATQYSVVKVSNSTRLMANALSSASMLRKDLRIEPPDLNRLSFSWQIHQLIEGADMSHRDHDDSPVRLVLAFDGDRSLFSPKNAMLSELSHALTGRPMPYATLMYVWSNHRPVESVIVNPRTDRVRKLVLESGAERVNQWLTYERDVRADFEKAFGEPPGALIGIGLMTDSDNTRSHAQAWYGTIRLH